MKYFIAILGLITINMAVREAAADDSQLQSHEYTLPISLISSKDASDTVIDTSRWNSDKTVVYNRKVDDNNPIYLTGNVVITTTNEEVAVFPTQNVLIPCSTDENGSWESVMVQTIVQSLTPDGSCPIEAGSYKLDPSKVLDISATFRDVLKCGEYELNLSLIDPSYNTIVEAKYGFNTDDLPNSSTCK